jgi:hypothetical protein
MNALWRRLSLDPILAVLLTRAMDRHAFAMIANKVRRMRMQSSWKRAPTTRLAGAGCALALIAGMAAAAVSQERLEQGSGIMKACAGDVGRLCPGTLPGGARIQDCIQSKMGQLSKPCLGALLDAMAGASFKVCKDQTYALCAAAKCNVFDGVAYCQCDVKHGDSISLPFPTGSGEDVCSINAAGADNKYMMSAYSLPEQLASPQGGGAVYTCPGDTSDGTYAQCDGGLCFPSSEETSFPGFDKPMQKGQIICSCPIKEAKPHTSQAGYQILGPYPCDKSFFRYCKGATANSRTGSKIYVGAPIGAAARLAVLLNGHASPINECGVETRSVSVGPTVEQRKPRAASPDLPTHAPRAAERPQTVHGR